MMRPVCLTLLALLLAASVIAQSSTTPATHGVDSTVLQNLPSQLGVEGSSAAALARLAEPQFGAAQNTDDVFGSRVWSTAADELLTSLKKSPAFKTTDLKRLTELEQGKTARQRFTIRLAVLEQLAEHAK